MNLIKSKKDYLPWVEKYRPTYLNDLILEETTKTKMYNFFKNKSMSNMIITGSPGTGKTSTILCLAKELYKNKFNEAVIEYNASDNRGLETINNSIIYFCKKKINLHDNLPKLVILDEADNITKKAQNTLCNLMENYLETTKFVLTCNDYNKLVEGIQTRCIIIRFNSLSDNLIVPRLKLICEKEKIIYTDDGLKSILFISQGDVRLAINYLEMTYYGFQKITSNNVYKICEKPSEFEVKKIINQSLDGNLKDSLKDILKLKKDGYCNSDILLTIINYLKQSDFEDGLKINLMEIVSNIYININNDSNLQMLKCVAEFYLLKKLI